MRTLLVLIVLFGAVAAGAYLHRRFTRGDASTFQGEASMETSFRAFVKRIRPELRLVTAELRTLGLIRKKDSNWRGTTIAQVTTSIRILFACDLSEIGDDDFSFSSGTRLLRVRVPAPQMIAAEVDLDDNDVMVDTGWARFRALSGAGLENACLRDLPEEAKKLGDDPDVMNEARRLTKVQVAELMKKLFRRAGCDVKDVEIDFAEP